MNFYPHHIGDFNNATRHLTRVERSLYADCIWLYYDTEQPLQANSFETLARKVMARSDEERDALRNVLDEFFVLDGDVYRNDRCDAEIAAYRAKHDTAIKAGKASAAKRAERKVNGRSTGVKQANKERSTNQEPITNNQEPIKDKGTRRKASLPVPVDWKPNPGTAQRAAMEFSLQAQQVEAYRIAFLDICQAKGYTYANIDAAFINCIRKDWPGLRTQNGKPAPVVDLEAKRKAETLAALDPEARLEAIRRDFAERNAGMSGVNLRAMP